MTAKPEQDETTDHDAEMHAEAMKDQLRNDVTSWKAARSEEAVRQTDIAVPVTKPAHAKAAAKPKTAKVPAVATTPADDKKKPFRMSYNGTTNADYITYMISRGAR